MPATFTAGNFHSSHPKSIILRKIYRSGNSLVKCRPTTAGIVFVRRIKKLRSTADAFIHALVEQRIVFACKRSFCSLLAKNFIFLRTKLFLPVFFRFFYFLLHQ